MAKFTFIYSPNRLSFGREYIVHRAGCADIALAMKRATSQWDVESADVESAIALTIKDEFDGSGGDFNFDRSDYHVAPCARGKV